MGKEFKANGSDLHDGGGCHCNAALWCDRPEVVMRYVKCGCSDPGCPGKRLMGFVFQPRFAVFRYNIGMVGLSLN